MAFKTAHGIAARVLKAHTQQPDAPLAGVLASASAELLGAPLQYTDAQLAGILSPRHFIDVRRTLGGPNPDETARALKESRGALERDRSSLTATRQALAAAETRLRERSAAL